VKSPRATRRGKLDACLHKLVPEPGQRAVDLTAAPLNNVTVHNLGLPQAQDPLWSRHSTALR
jgi:hypothetical protein